LRRLFVSFPVWLLGLAVIVQAPKASEPAWKTYTTREGGFSVSLPDEPNEQKQTKETKNGPVKVVIVSCEHQSSAFLVMNIPLGNPIPEDKEDAFFESMKSRLTKDDNAKLLSERKIMVDARPGHEYVIEKDARDSTERVVARSRFILDHQVAYHVSMVVPKDRDSPRDATRLFASFKLLKAARETEKSTANTEEKPNNSRTDAAVQKAQADGRAWTVYAPPRAGFSVLMPGRPDEKDEEQQISAGNFTMHNFAVREEDGVYTGSHFQLPGMLEADNASVKRVLETLQQGTVRAHKGTLIKEEATSFEGNPGREFQYSLPPGAAIQDGVAKARMIFANGRFYVIIVMGTQAKVDSPDTDRYLNSFRLVRNTSLPAATPKSRKRPMPDVPRPSN
jgi:hypothetical protein